MVIINGNGKEYVHLFKSLIEIEQCEIYIHYK